MITIYQTYKVLKEGTADEVAQLQAQVSAIDTQLQRVSQPLIARKNRLTTMLAQKQKMLSQQSNTAQPTTPTPAPQPGAQSPMAPAAPQ